MDHLFEPDRGRDVRALPGERGVDGFRFPFGPAPDDGEVFLRDPLFLHQEAEAPGGSGALGDEDQATGFAIEPIDDGNLAAVRDLEREQIFQFAPESASGARLGGMNKEERRLIDDEKIVVLGDDGEVAAVCAGRFAGG